MELKDLKTGMVVKNREGNYYMVINDCIVREKEYDTLNKFNDDLTNKCFKKLDIVEVYNEREGYKLMFKNWFKNIKNEEPIWKREEEVDWSKVPQWTKVQIRDFNESEWENAYFIKYNNNDTLPFYITLCDKFTYSSNPALVKFKQCRLYKEEEE